MTTCLKFTVHVPVSSVAHAVKRSFVIERQGCKWLQITEWRLGTSNTSYRYRYSTSRICAKAALFKPIGKLIFPHKSCFLSNYSFDRIKDLINVYKYLKGRCKEGRAKLFSVVPSGRTRGHGQKLKHKSFPLNIRNHFFTVRMTKHWHRLPREVVESPSLEIFKSHLDMVLGNRL